jgi:hypothetical protein
MLGSANIDPGNVTILGGEDWNANLVVGANVKPAMEVIGTQFSHGARELVYLSGFYRKQISFPRGTGTVRNRLGCKLECRQGKDTT